MNTIRFILLIGDSMIKKLAIYLEKEMKRQDISSAQKLAKLCNNKISPDFINKIKRNEPQTITLDTITILADGLNLTLKEILENSGIIEDYGIHGVSLEEAEILINMLNPLFQQYSNIDIANLNNNEKVNLANQLIEFIKTVSYMYK